MLTPPAQGGSIRGTTVAHGEYGLRILESARLSAAQLQACREALRRKLRPVKGSKLYLRVFPDIPICVKGNEVRMGKGKGSFEYWACRCVCVFHDAKSPPSSIALYTVLLWTESFISHCVFKLTERIECLLVASFGRSAVREECQNR